MASKTESGVSPGEAFRRAHPDIVKAWRKLTPKAMPDVAAAHREFLERVKSLGLPPPKSIEELYHLARLVGIPRDDIDKWTAGNIAYEAEQWTEEQRLEVERERFRTKLRGGHPSIADELPTSSKKGVSLLDAASLLNDGDTNLARETVARWQKQRKVKLPASIGNCPKHSQRKLYEPSALSDFLEKIGDLESSRKKGVLRDLRRVAR